jgi:hypothetical protein
MKRLTRPMNRADWAWFSTCVAFGLFVATLATLSEIGDSRPSYGTKYTFATVDGKPVAETVEPLVIPSYATRITILTNGNARDLIQAAHNTDPNIETSITSNHPRMRVSEYFFILFVSTIAFMLFSYLFRISEKIIGRILGVKK